MNSALNPSGPHACTWRHVLHKYSERQDRVVDAVDVEALMAEPEPGCSNDVFSKHLGDPRADLLAKQGTALHAPKSADIKMVKTSKVTSLIWMCT